MPKALPRAIRRRKRLAVDAPATRVRSAKLTVEVAEDPEFQQVIATTHVAVAADADWTCRVLIGGFKPVREYWYRFTVANGDGSRIGGNARRFRFRKPE